MNLITPTGRKINPANPQPSDICMEDISLGLAKQERFDGNTISPYSVAQHSCVVADLVAAGWGGCNPTLETVKAALLHDASEAYIGDIVQPLKRLLPDYARIEELWTRAIFVRYGIDPGLVHHFQVKSADQTAFICECCQLVPNTQDYGLDRARCCETMRQAAEYASSVHFLAPNRVFSRALAASNFSDTARLLGIV